MARLSFSKAALHKESAQLKRYQQYLPSLDLKRKQLLAERTKATTQLSEIEELINNCQSFVAEQLPMMSDENINLCDLVYIKQTIINEENIVGVALPYLHEIEMYSKPYSFITKPHWVDQVVVQLTKMLELQVRFKIHQQRLEILQLAVKKVTQRVNLFDKVLIPKAQKNIGKIKIFLSDTERTSVIRAKITKQKRLKESF